MARYHNEGIYLNRALIKELLIECFGTGDECASQEIYETLSEAHLDRGGTIDDPRRVRSRIRGALRALANEGMAENTGRSRWIIYSPEATDPSETSSVAINRNRGIMDGFIHLSDMLSGLSADDFEDGGASLLEEVLNDWMNDFEGSEYGRYEEGRFEGHQSILLIFKGISLSMPKAS